MLDWVLGVVLAAVLLGGVLAEKSDKCEGILEHVLYRISLKVHYLA